MMNFTTIPDDELADSNIFQAGIAGAMVDGYVNESVPDRIMGYTGFVAYWPISGQAAHVTNGNPDWFPAESLTDAINHVIEEA